MVRRKLSVLCHDVSHWPSEDISLYAASDMQFDDMHRPMHSQGLLILINARRSKNPASTGPVVAQNDQCNSETKKQTGLTLILQNSKADKVRETSPYSSVQTNPHACCGRLDKARVKAVSEGISKPHCRYTNANCKFLNPKQARTYMNTNFTHCTCAALSLVLADWSFAMATVIGMNLGSDAHFLKMH